MKKLTTLAVILPLLGALLLPGISSAQSVDALQAQLNSLLAQVQQLEAQLAQAQGGSAQWCHAFNTNLSINMSGSEVNALQTALQKDGESVTVNGTFDDQTAAAVTGFQEKYAAQILTPNGLLNGTGYAGVSTRAELNSLYRCNMSTGTGIGINNPPVITGVTPDTGGNGTQVTITGTNFTPTGNTVNGGETYIQNIFSPNGTTLTFTLQVPPIECPAGFIPCNQPTSTQLDVVNANGTSNIWPFALPAPNQTPTPTPVTILSPTAGQSFSSGNSMNIQWTPTSGGVAEIDLVPADGSWPTHGSVIYSLKVWNYPTNYSGSFTYTIPQLSSQIPTGSYYLNFYNSASYSGTNQGPGTLIGQSGAFTIAATTSPVVTGVTSAGTPPNPGSNAFIIGINLPTQNAAIVIDPGSVYTQTVTPTSYNNGGSINFVVPSNINLGSHTIEVQANGITSNQLSFSVVPVTTAAPYISALNPTTAAPGATVTVTGYNFDSNSYISLGNVPTGAENFPVAVTLESPTTLTFTVPSNFATGPQPLYVAEHGSSLVSNKGTLTILTAPYISQVNPATVAPGATVTVTGQNFDANSYVSLGNAPNKPESQSITPTSYTSTSLTFVIPTQGVYSVGTAYPNPLYVAENNSSLVSNQASLTIQ